MSTKRGIFKFSTKAHPNTWQGFTESGVSGEGFRYCLVFKERKDTKDSGADAPEGNTRTHPEHDG